MVISTASLLPGDPEAWKVFQRKIRAKSKAANWADLKFASEAEALYATYRNIRGAELRKLDHTLIPYLELIRQDWGLEAVHSEVQSLLAKGAVPKTLATAAQYSARAGKNLTAAVEMVEIVYGAHSDNPLVNLVLGQAYAALGQWSEIDKTAKTALRQEAVTPWTAMRWGRLTVDNCRFEIAREFLPLLEEESVSRNLLSTRIASFEDQSEIFDLPTYLINLDSEPRKLRLSMELVEHGGYSPVRVTAVDGRTLPAFAHEKLGFTPNVYAEQGAGAVATALSHIGIWEKFLAGPDSHCLIIEDDAAPYVHWTYHRETLQEVSKFDLVWGNERMSQVLGSTRVPAKKLATPWEILGGRPTAFRGIGTDCYILSKRGAECLLEMFHKHEIRGHIDGQMGAYSIGDTSDAAQNKTQSLTQNMRKTMGVGDGLSSTCLTTPAIFANDHGVSNTIEISRDHRESIGG